MTKPPPSALEDRRFFRGLRRLGRNAAVLAVGPALSLALSEAVAASVAQSPLTVTNTGTLLRAESAPFNAIAPVTLSSGSELSAQPPETIAQVSEILVSLAPVVPNAEPNVSAQDSFLSHSVDYTSPFAAGPDDTEPFQEMAAAPEPSTWFAALLAFALLGWQQRRRLLSRATFPPRIS